MSVRIEKMKEVRGVVVSRLARTDLPPGECFDLDLMQAVALEAALKELVAPPAGRIVLELSLVTYMDSKTFWAMVRAADALRVAGGCLVVSGLHANISRLLELTGADEFLQAYATADEAVAALEAR